MEKTVICPFCNREVIVYDDGSGEYECPICEKTFTDDDE